MAASTIQRQLTRVLAVPAAQEEDALHRRRDGDVTRLAEREPLRPGVQARERQRRLGSRPASVALDSIAGRRLGDDDLAGRVAEQRGDGGVEQSDLADHLGVLDLAVGVVDGLDRVVAGNLLDDLAVDHVVLGRTHRRRS